MANKIPKTKICDWCYKRKSVEEGYWIGEFLTPKKYWFICKKCNLIHDAV